MNSKSVSRGVALAYMPQIDGLRTICVVFVMMAHFFPEGHWLTSLGLAGLGVRCFFVLSGYLITGILLRIREDIESAGVSVPHGFLHFYMRRALRIFPAYYLTVLLIVLADVQHARQSLPWLLTYTTNIQFSLVGHLYWSTGHFWSLAVEEQFYLIWPWFVLLCSRRALLATLVLMVISAPLFCLFCKWMGPAYYTAQTTLLFGCTDALGLGAAMAVAERWGVGRRHIERLGWRRGILSGITACALLVMLRLLDVPLVPSAFISTAISWMLVWVVYGAIRGYRGFLGRILEWRPLMYLGRISYGLYLYHVFMLVLMPVLLGWFGLHLPEAGGPRFMILSAATIVVASISWYALEGPINRLKRHFPL